jgi:hypothetical protein
MGRWEKMPGRRKMSLTRAFSGSMKCRCPPLSLFLSMNFLFPVFEFGDFQARILIIFQAVLSLLGSFFSGSSISRIHPTARDTFSCWMFFEG